MFSCLSDYFSGKTDSVGKNAVEHAVKKKRRRANRINLIAEEADDVTGLDEIEGINLETEAKVDVFSVEDGLEVPVGDLLSSTPSTATVQVGGPTQQYTRYSTGKDR